MAALAQEKCFNHRDREAVARCPPCGRFFCRECVTEHDGQVVCAGCLRGMARGGERRRARWQSGRLVVAAALGLVVAWLSFHAVGRLLLLLPESFHEGTLWHAAPAEEAEGGPASTPAAAGVEPRPPGMGLNTEHRRFGIRAVRSGPRL